MYDPVPQNESRNSLHGDPRDLAPEAHKALTLCLEAVSSFGDGEACGTALDALEELLPLLAPSDIDALIGHPEYVAVRAKLIRACAETWFQRECDLASRALDDESSLTLRTLFDDHIPRDAYADELAVLRSIEPRNILIIGSGACPMSAIVIQDAFPAAAVVGMDRSPRACELSARLLTAYGHRNVTILRGDAAGPIDVQRFDCILLALTVGIDEADKRRIIRSLRGAADPAATLVVRTAAGWGRVLYPGTDLPVISARANLHRSISAHQRSVAVAVPFSELPD
ncbi:MAG: nicotianamine synthase family protein [Gammaproteobacteria bacterium]|nr:nicotianamine synthase family protein [Gammaproteobacteria bacterium]